MMELDYPGELTALLINSTFINVFLSKPDLQSQLYLLHVQTHQL